METQTSHPYASPLSFESPTRSVFRSARFWIPAIVCFLGVLCVPVAFIIGAILGNQQIYNNFASHQQSRIEAFLREDPEAFGDLTVEHASNGWAYPSGTVNTQADFDRLSNRLHEMFGDELADDMMGGVSVR
jgi:hypothetical protein